MSLLHYLNNISVWWHAVGTFSLVVAILAKAPTHQSGSFVFRQFIDNTGADGFGWGDRASHVYVVVVGVGFSMLALRYVYGIDCPTDFDGPIHLNW